MDANVKDAAEVALPSSTKEAGQIRLTTRPLRAWTGRLVDPEGDATVAD